MNGLDEIKITWTRPSLSACEVVVCSGPREVFTGLRDETGFDESTALNAVYWEDTVIDGIDIPEGVGREEDRVRAAKESAWKMKANYQAFLDQRKAAREKEAQGKPLAKKEQEIFDIDAHEKMEKWIDAKRLAEGIRLKVGGRQLPGQKGEDLTPPATTPWEKLQKEVIVDLNEESHVEKDKERAKKFGLDWDERGRWFRCIMRRKRLREALEDALNKAKEKLDGKEPPDSAPAPMPDPLGPAPFGDSFGFGGPVFPDSRADDWAEENKDKLDRYVADRDDPDTAAEEEIQEYEAQIKFYTELLKKLMEEQEKKDKAANPDVPN